MTGWLGPRRRLAVGVAVLVVAPVMGWAAAKLTGPPRQNPEADELASFQAATGMPPEVAATLQRACGDCHTNRTRWPWYSHVAPVSWFVADHVNHGRRHLNLSEWSRAGGGERVKEPAAAICKEVRAGQMPLGSYLWLHRSAALRAGEVEAICRWSEAVERAARAITPSSSDPSKASSREGSSASRSGTPPAS
jgi:heme-binding protein